MRLRVMLAPMDINYNVTIGHSLKTSGRIVAIFEYFSGENNKDLTKPIVFSSRASKLYKISTWRNEMSKTMSPSGKNVVLFNKKMGLSHTRNLRWQFWALPLITPP